MSLERYVGTHVILKEAVPSDHRGKMLDAGTTLYAGEMVSDEHFNLRWPVTHQLAATQVHFSKLKTGVRYEGSEVS